MSAASFARSPCVASVSPRVAAFTSSKPSRLASFSHAAPRRSRAVARISASLDEASSSSNIVDVADKPSTSSATSVASPPSPQIPQDTVPSTPATFSEWELDFGSRPVLDERGKKWWELLIVGTKRSDDDGEKSASGDDGKPWVYSRWLPNTKINSAQVRNKGIKEAAVEWEKTEIAATIAVAAKEKKKKENSTEQRPTRFDDDEKKKKLTFFSSFFLSYLFL